MDVKFEYNKLQGLIKEKFGSQESMSVAMGMSRISLNKKLNNASMFTQEEIIKAMHLLGIPKSEVSNYFFCTESLENKTAS